MAAELAYKATNAQRELDELTLKHKNLHANHVAMQGKYHALKQGGHEKDWKAKAKELAERFEKHVTDTRQDMLELAKLKEEMPAVKAKLQELKKLKQEMPEVQAKLQELARLKKEMPEVQAKLQELKQLKQGKAAAGAADHVQAKLKEEIKSLQKELSTVKQAGLKTKEKLPPEVKASLKELAQLKSELPDVQARLRELASLKRELPDVQAKLMEGRSAKLEAAAAKDSLLHERAAKRNISEALESCKQMLAHTEGVLRVCADLHAKQSSGGELSSALTETTDKMRCFLQGLTV